MRLVLRGGRENHFNPVAWKKITKILFVELLKPGVEIKNKAGEFFYPFPETELRPEYQTNRNDVYPDVRVEIRHFPFELARGVDKIIEAVQPEKSPVGGIGVKIWIRKMRHKDVRGAVWLQHSHNFTHQKFKVVYMFKDADAMDFVGTSIRQERQSIFEVSNNVHNRQVCFINTYPALFFPRSAAKLDTQPLAR